MQTVAKEICNAVEDRDDLTLSKVASLIGASKNTLSKFKAKGEIGFRYLLRLSYLLFPDNQKEKMADWCLRVDSVESIKQSFEYAAISRNIQLLGNLITKHKNEKGSIGEFVAVYTVIYKYMTNEINGIDIITHIKNCGQIKDEILKVLIEILKCYNYYFQSKYHLMLETAHEAEKALLFLGKRELFFKECFLHRIAEALEPAYLFLNNHELARHYASIIINADICPKTVSDASYIVGMSYLLEDSGKSLEYLQKSYDIAKTIGDGNIENEARLNLDFVKLYLNVKLPEDSDPALINFQENKESEINLDSLKEVMYQKGEDDLIVLFETISSGSIQKFHENFLEYFQQTNYFFASIMAKELRDRGDNTIWSLQAMNFTIKNGEVINFEKDFISGFSRFNNRSKRGCA
jgi:hypothetical protein